MEEGVVMTGVVAMAEGTRTTIRITRDVVVAVTLATFSVGLQAFLLDHHHQGADTVVVGGLGVTGADTTAEGVIRGDEET